MGGNSSRVGAELVRAKDVSVDARKASHALAYVSLLETCVLLSVGSAWLRVRDASLAAEDAYHEATCAAYEETSRSHRLRDESLRDGDGLSHVGGEPVHAGDVSLRVQDAFYTRRDDHHELDVGAWATRGQPRREHQARSEASTSSVARSGGNTG